MDQVSFIPMTLDEAIAHARRGQETGEECKHSCAASHWQLASWLEELKERKTRKSKIWLPERSVKTKFIIFNIYMASLPTMTLKSFQSFARRAKAKASRTQMMVEANGHQVYFRTGSPYRIENNGLSADVTIPHYEIATLGSKHLGGSRHGEFPTDRIIRILKGKRSCNTDSDRSSRIIDKRIN